MRDTLTLTNITSENYMNFYLESLLSTKRYFFYSVKSLNSLISGRLRDLLTHVNLWSYKFM